MTSYCTCLTTENGHGPYCPVLRIEELEKEYKEAMEAWGKDVKELTLSLSQRENHIAELESRLAEYEKVADQIIEAHETVAMPFVMDEVDELRALREGE